MSTAVNHAGLEFFSSLGGQLKIELTEPAHAISERLANQVAPPSARIVSVSFTMYVFTEASMRELTDAEWNRGVLKTSRIRMRDIRTPETFVEIDAVDGAEFKVRDLAKAVEQTELHCRGRADWFDGVDVHHVFFEGMTLGADDVWELHWGS